MLTPGERRRTSLPPGVPSSGGKRGRGPPSLSQPLFGGPRPRPSASPGPALPRPRPLPSPASPPGPPLPRPRPAPGVPLPRPRPGPGPALPWPRPSPGPAPGPGPALPRAHEPRAHEAWPGGLKPAGRPQIYKYSGELDAATELLDRALYCLEAAWHPQFKPASGACRLDFAVMENKAWSSGACRCSFAAAAPAPPSGVQVPSGAGGGAGAPRALRLVRAGAALSRREPPLFLPIALNSSAYALMRVARDGGAAPVDEPVLRRLFSHTLDPASPAPPPPSAAALAAALLRQAVLMYPGAVRPLLENYNVKPDSGGLGRPTQAALFDDDEPAASVELPPLTAGIGPWTSSML
eukprot:tig00000663_g2939.t1